MKLLADENFPAPVIAALRQRGHDVLAVAQRMPGAPDATVLAAAVDGQRLLLTLDRVDEWVGHFTTVTDTLIRSRDFPKSR